MVSTESPKGYISMNSTRFREIDMESTDQTRLRSNATLITCFWALVRLTRESMKLARSAKDIFAMLPNRSAVPEW